MTAAISLKHQEPVRANGAGGDMNDVLLLVGQLNYTWTNTESLLIYLIAGLAGVDKETAIVIFLTLNTTRARLDLVERLAKLPKTIPACRRDVLALTAKLARQQKLRNKYNHCIYSFDEAGKLSHTQLMRIVDTARNVLYGKVEQVNKEEIARIRTSISEIAEVNRLIWQLVRAYGFPQ
jgi:hypothetical protein